MWIAPLKQGAIEA